MNCWGEPFSWRGFQAREGTLNGFSCKIVLPPAPRSDRRWVWRPEFFDVYAEVDEEMVRRGHHLVYLDIRNHYGAPAAIREGEALYRLMTEDFGLHHLVSFIAISRGGLTALNWTLAHPETVARLYLDNPVCDIKSWPAGWGTGPGSPEDWARCLSRYGLTEAEARQFRETPADRAATLAGTGVPILAVYGDADETVPAAENILRIRTACLRQGSPYFEIVKPGGGHHPAGLPDPAPIVNFLDSE